MEDRDLPQNTEIGLQSGGSKTESGRADRQPARDPLSPQLADILDDHDESNYAGSRTGTGVHDSGDLSARPVGERQPSAGPPGNSLSLYLTKLARLGGYLARAKDPPPGNIVMWRGLSRLTDIQLGFLIGAQLVGN